MLDLSLIRTNPSAVADAMRVKGIGDPSIVDRIVDLDVRQRECVTQLQQLQAESNSSAKKIGELMRSGRRDEASPLIKANADAKEKLQELEADSRTLSDELDDLLLELPNIPHESVPVGATPEENVTIGEFGERPSFDFDPKPHWELLEIHGLVDFARGSKVTGAGFPFYIGKGASLQRALINFFLDEAGRKGYTELQTPIVVNEDSARGTGQLPDKEDQMYVVARDEFFLIPTAEVPVTNFHREEIFAEADLPKQYAAYTPCFRREAGSYGSDVRGLNRLHQFDKVELVKFVHPDASYDELESLREDAEDLLRKLKLPYRRLLMCTGDMGFTQAKKYDLEIFSGGQNRWLEVSSISNFEAFQARRSRIRFKPSAGGQPRPLHTLNGSGLALPRIVAGILENYQTADGSITIPDVLVPYTGFVSI
ncbi:MAG: serine--tRNA ligase [Bacteroidetes bacterium]|nr:serine--tRNA ligase [Bacteroidota bacterium]